jgi:hypothetical protein
VGQKHYESAAIATFYYSIYSLALMYMHNDNPIAWFKNHPDKMTFHKMLNGAYNRGLWWDGLKSAFDDCTKKDVLNCFQSASNGSIAYDHAGAIVDYSTHLDKSEPFDVPVAFSDFEDFVDGISALYHEVDKTKAKAAMKTAFDSIKNGSETISFRKIKPVLKALIDFLPPPPTVQEATEKACKLAQLWKSPPC